MLIRVVVDGVEHRLATAPGASLLTVLREQLGLTATKDACEQGECGACTVWLDGDIVCACLVPAAQLHGREVKTVASLAGVGLHPLQEAFLQVGAVQCGYCTPGMVVAGVDLLERDPHPTEPAVREALAGNLCRCTGYEKIVEAVLAAAKDSA